MGLFGSKKKVHVASTVYNMAGDFDPKQTYMKATILSSVLYKKDIGQGIINSLVNGPYNSKKRFFNWGQRTNYDGNITTVVNRQKEIDLTLIYPELTVPSGQLAYINKAFIERCDIVFFAEKHIIETDISLRYTAWTASLYSSTEIEITYEDTSTEIVTLPLDFNLSGDYLVIYYDLFNEEYNDDLVEGAIIVSNDLPDTDDYTTTLDEITETVDVTLTTTTHILHEFSNEDPDTEENYTDDDIVPFDRRYKEKNKVTYLGNTVDQTLTYQTYYYNEWLDYEIVEDVDVTVDVIDHGTYTETITTTITTESIENKYSYQENEQLTHTNEFVSTNMIIYLIGSGNAVYDDFIDETSEAEGEFMPIIPLRINNVSITDIPAVYEPARQAYRKLNGNQSIDKLLESIEDNASIGDIDYSYICMGVSLNSTYKRDKKYMYLFFKNLIAYQFYDRAYYEQWFDKQVENEEFIDTFTDWFNAQSNPLNPLFGTSKPINRTINQGINAESPVVNRLTLETNNVFHDNFHTELVWLDISEETLSGLGKIDAEIGEYWFDFNVGSGSIKDWWRIYLTGFSDLVPDEAEGLDNIEIYMYHQVSETVHTKLTITGLEYRNYVYGFNYVKITGRDSLQDEEINGFIVPLHIPTLQQLSAVDRNEIVLYSQQLIFNSLVITKTRWYQSGLFQIVVIIVIVVISIYVAGGFGAALSSTIATGTAVAALFGVTAIGLYAAFFIGLGVTLLQGIILMYVLQQGFELVFDKQTAALLAVISTIIITAGTSISSEGSLSFDVSELTDITTIIKLTTTSLNNIMQYASDVPDLLNSVQDLSKQYNELQENIEQGNAALGISSYSNDFLKEVLAQNILTEYNETSEQYLNRTMCTSSNIIEASLNMVNKFTELFLQLKKDNY